MRLGNIVITILAAAAALQLAACGVGQASVTTADQQEAMTPLPVEVLSPVKADIFATYHTTATISSDSEAAVLARVDGEVVEILVEEGDQVSEGQILARLDGDRLRLLQTQAKANLDKVRREYERFVRLHEKGLVSASAIDSLRFDMDALEAAFKLQRLDYEYTTIRAPISGIVSARDIKIGQHVDVNDTTFRITDTSQLVAYLRIPQTELSKFSAGHLAEVRVDAMPGQTFDALIARISPTIDMRNGTFRATAYIDNEDGLVAPGMFGRFEIAYEQHTDALMIPLAALVSEDSQTVVYVVEEGAASRRIIRTGIQSGENVEVLEGLEEHEQIVVTGQGTLRDGSRVFASIESTGPITG
jgi:membrane fusion protein (multidrug efflux system)